VNRHLAHLISLGKILNRNYRHVTLLPLALFGGSGSKKTPGVSLDRVLDE
jgi:hypothetical protein